MTSSRVIRHRPSLRRILWPSLAGAVVSVAVIASELLQQAAL